MKYTLRPTDQHTHRVKLDIEGVGKTRKMTGSQYALLRGLVTKLGLPFEFEERADWHFIRPRGIILNVQARMRHEEELKRLQEYREVLREYEELVHTQLEMTKERPQIQFVGEDVVARFVKSLTSWDEVLESAVPGEEMTEVPPRIVAPPDARMAVRLQPVRFRKVVAGKEFWAITPPMPFSLHADHIMSGMAGHPHVFPALNLCVGTAQFEYANPFQSMGMLRQWYVGYSPKDLGDKNWVAHSRMWWRGNGEEFIARDDAWLVEAPDEARGSTGLVKISAEEVEAFCRATGWVPGERRGNAKARPEHVMEAYERYGYLHIFDVVALPNLGPCEVCGSMTARSAIQEKRDGVGAPHEVISHRLCACHLAELGYFDPLGGNGGAKRNWRDYKGAMVVTEGLWEGARCQCDEIFEGAPMPTLNAIGLVEGMGVCQGHANLLTGRRGYGEGGNHADLDRMVLSGELGAQRALMIARYVTQFPLRKEGWDSPCLYCGDTLEAHWGLCCPSTAPFRLGAEDARNRLGIEAWSRWDFTDEVRGAQLAEEVARLRTSFAANKNLKGETSFADLIRRLNASDGSALDEEGQARFYWVSDTLRKFGPDLDASTRCTDCGGTWKEHSGPNCL